MQNKLLKLFLFFSLILVLFSPMTVSADPEYNITTGRYEQSLPEFNAQNNANKTNQAGLLTCKLGTDPKLQHLLKYATCIISDSVIPLLFALAVVMFVWGVVMFVINSSEEVKKEKGRQFMIWGIIALAVMVSIWGLVRMLGSTFGIEYVVPQVKSVK